MRFRKNRSPVPGYRCRADIVFSRARVAVFVDGCFWHRCPEHGSKPRSNSGYWQAKLDRNIDRDRRNDEILSAAGWCVVRIWEHEDAGEAAEKISGIVKARLSHAEAP